MHGAPMGAVPAQSRIHWTTHLVFFLSKTNPCSPSGFFVVVFVVVAPL